MSRAWHMPFSQWLVFSSTTITITIITIVTNIIITIICIIMKLRPREMKDFSKIVQLWLVAKQSLPHRWVFPFHHPETAQFPGPKNLQHFIENI